MNYEVWHIRVIVDYIIFVFTGSFRHMLERMLFGRAFFQKNLRQRKSRSSPPVIHNHQNLASMSCSFIKAQNESSIQKKTY